MKQQDWKVSDFTSRAAKLAMIVVLTAMGVAAAAGPPGFASRDDVLRMLDGVESLAAAIGDDPALLAGVAEARRQVATATPEQLAALAPFGERLARMEALLARIRAGVEAPDGSSSASPEAFFPPGSDSVARLDAPAAAVASTLCGGPRRTDTELFQLLSDTLGAEIEQMTASRLCEQVLVVGGTGGNLSLLCILSDVLYMSARGAYEAILMCERLRDRAEIEVSALGVEQIRADIGAIGSGLGAAVGAASADVRASVIETRTRLLEEIAAVGEAVADAAAAASAAVVATLQDSGDRFLRLEIEKALHSRKAVAGLYLPQAHGGQLERIRQIVRETIDNVRSSGEPVGNALSHLAKGDREYAAGRWRKAYASYSQAYVAAVDAP